MEQSHQYHYPVHCGNDCFVLIGNSKVIVSNISCNPVNVWIGVVYAIRVCVKNIHVTNQLKMWIENKPQIQLTLKCYFIWYKITFPLALNG